MVFKAHPSEVILGSVAGIVIKMGNLAELLSQIACEVETEGAAPGTLCKDRGFHSEESLFTGRLRPAHQCDSVLHTRYNIRGGKCLGDEARAKIDWNHTKMSERKRTDPAVESQVL